MPLSRFGSFKHYVKLYGKFHLEAQKLTLSRIASEEALDNGGLDTLAELLENQSNTSITEHALRALAEITYPKRCKVSTAQKDLSGRPSDRLSGFGMKNAVFNLV